MLTPLYPPLKKEESHRRNKYKNLLWSLLCCSSIQFSMNLFHLMISFSVLFGMCLLIILSYSFLWTSDFCILVLLLLRFEKLDKCFSIWLPSMCPMWWGEKCWLLVFCSIVWSNLIFCHCLDMWVAGERSRFCPSCKGKCLMLPLSPTCDQASIVCFSCDF